MTAPDELETTLLEWAKGPYRLDRKECIAVMARLAELEATNDTLREAIVGMVEMRERMVAENQVLRNQAGNAVGAIVDSGGYCEGPHDVADAIYRLTAERDRLKAELDELTEDDWDGPTEFVPCETSGNATVTCAFCGTDIHLTFGADGNVGPVACPGCGSTYLSGATVKHPLLGAADPLHTHNTPEPNG